MLTLRHYLDESLDSSVWGLWFEHWFIAVRGTVVGILHGEHTVSVQLHHGERREFARTVHLDQRKAQLRRNLSATENIALKIVWVTLTLLLNQEYQ